VKSFVTNPAESFAASGARSDGLSSGRRDAPGSGARSGSCSARSFPASSWRSDEESLERSFRTSFVGRSERPIDRFAGCSLRWRRDSSAPLRSGRNDTPWRSWRVWRYSHLRHLRNLRFVLSGLASVVVLKSWVRDPEVLKPERICIICGWSFLPWRSWRTWRLSRLRLTDSDRPMATGGRRMAKGSARLSERYRAFW